MSADGPTAPAPSATSDSESGPLAADLQVGAARKWTITGTVMLVTVMQVLDVTVTNVALPHIQGSLSAGVDEVSWVLTSYLAANAVVLPATGWLAGALGRKRFFLVCTALFTLSSVLCGLAPNITVLLLARMLQGLSGGPLMPLSQAIMWEIFPAPAARHGHGGVGHGHHDGADLRADAGRVDLRQLVVAVDLLHQRPHRRRGLLGVERGAVRPAVSAPARARGRARARADGRRVPDPAALPGPGERYEWFDSTFILVLAILAVLALAGFFLRELTTVEPILDLTVYGDRNFAAASLIMLIMMVGFFSSMVMLALFTQKVLGFDAWTSGLVLTPGGMGNMFSLLVAGRLITRWTSAG